MLPRGNADRDNLQIRMHSHRGRWEREKYRLVPMLLRGNAYRPNMQTRMHSRRGRWEREKDEF